MFLHQEVHVELKQVSGTRTASNHTRDIRGNYAHISLIFTSICEPVPLDDSSVMTQVVITWLLYDITSCMAYLSSTGHSIISSNKHFLAWKRLCSQDELQTLTQTATDLKEGGQKLDDILRKIENEKVCFNISYFTDNENEMVCFKWEGTVQQYCTVLYRCTLQYCCSVHTLTKSFIVCFVHHVSLGASFLLLRFVKYSYGFAMIDGVSIELILYTV